MADNQVQGTNGSVFISYSRKDKEFVRKLYDGLVAHEVKAWVDWEGIPLSADWMDEITRAVNGADAFLVVISPDWLASKVCADELELGLVSKKKLVPILYRDPLKGTTMHEKLAATNWVYLRDQDDFEATLPKLVDAIGTDLDWVRQHTRLLNRANEWDRKNRNSSFLLQGADLDDGEKWMGEAAQNAKREVLPVQAEYISVSRKEAVRRQRMLLVGVSLALIVSMVLGVFAFFQRNIAISNAKLAQDNAILANNNAATAVSNEQLAVRNENARATQQVRAEQNELTAKAQRNAAEAKLFQGLGGELGTSTMLALDSWALRPSFQAEEIVRQNLSILPIPVAQKKQKDRIWDLEISPDGSLLVSASEDGSACVWAVADGQNKYCVTSDKSIQDALFTLDGKQLITASEDGSLRFWNAADGTFIKRLDYGAILWDLDLSPDGSWLAVARADGFATLINLANSNPKVFNVKQPGPVTVVKFSPNSAWLGIGTETGQVSTLLVGSSFSSPGPNHAAEVFALAFSPDSKLIASAGADSNARVAKTESGKQILVLKHGDWVEDVDFSPDGKLLTTASDDNRVWIWDVATGLSAPRLHHDSYVQKARFSPDGKWIASTGYDQTLRVWNVVSGTQMLQAPLTGYGVALAFTPDNQRIIVGDRAGNITIWDVSTLSARLGYVEFPELVHTLQIAPSGEYWLANTDDKKVWKSSLVNLLTTTNGTNGEAIMTAEGLTYQLEVSSDSQWVIVSEDEKKRAILTNLSTKSQVLLAQDVNVNDVALSLEASLAATAGKDGKVVLWDLKSGQSKFTLGNDSEAFAVAFSRDGKQLAVGLSGSIAIWDLASQTKVNLLNVLGDVSRLAFSPDGNWLAVGSQQGEVDLWDAKALATTTAPKLMFNHTGRILSLAFSQDQKYLAVGGSQYFAYLWDLKTGQEVARIPHTDQVNSVAFTNDSAWLLTASLKVVQVWSIKDLPKISTADLNQEVCKKMTANISEADWREVYREEPYREICPGLPVGGN